MMMGRGSFGGAGCDVGVVDALAGVTAVCLALDGARGAAGLLVVGTTGGVGEGGAVWGFRKRPKTDCQACWRNETMDPLGRVCRSDRGDGWQSVRLS